MQSHYNSSPEQRAYKNPLMAGNLLSRLDHISFGPEYLKSVLDPDMLKEAEAYIASVATQNAAVMDEGHEVPVAEHEDNHDLRPEAAVVAGAAVVEAFIPEAPLDVDAAGSGNLLSEAEHYAAEPDYFGEILEDNAAPWSDDNELAA